MRKLVPFLICAALGTLAGCSGSATYRVSGTYATTAPDMVYVSPGVRVIADYDEPVFFADGSYWYNHDGYWYRSAYYNRGWTYVSSPPRVIASISSPHAYVHYRPHNYVVHRRPVQRFDRPVVRDHRARRGRVIYRNR